MNSAEHAAVGAAVGIAGAVLLADAYPPAVLVGLVVVAVGLSVLIDLDHFPIAWLLAGDLEPLRRALADPRRTATDPGFVFPDLEFPWLRLASHLLIGAVLVAATFTVDARVAGFLGAVVLAHVVADVLRDQGLASM